MNKLLQKMIKLGDVSDKYLTSLPKGYSTLPQFQGNKGPSQVGKRWYSPVVPDSIENYLEYWFADGAQEPKKKEEVVTTAYTAPEELDIHELNRRLKATVAYNHGAAATVKKLNELKSKGIDIYNSTDWIKYFDLEPRDYGQKIVLGTNPKFNKEYDSAVQVNPIVDYYEKYEDKDVPLDLLKRIAWKESTFNPNAYNTSGATGLTQVKPIALKEFNRLYGKDYKMEDLYNPEIAIEVQHGLMSHLYNRPWAMKKSDEELKKGGPVLPKAQWGTIVKGLNNAAKYFKNSKFIKGPLQMYPKGPVTVEEALKFVNTPAYKEATEVHNRLVSRYGSDWKLPNYMAEALQNNNRNYINPELYGGRNWSSADYVTTGIMGVAAPTALGLNAYIFAPPAVQNKINKTLFGIEPYKNDRLITKKDTTIDLTNRAMDYARVNENADGTVIIGGEFIEDAQNSVRKASDWLKAHDTFGDKKHKSDKVESFYGVENGKFKVGKASEFNPNTLIVPIRFGNSKISKAIPIEDDAGGDESLMRLLDNNNNIIYQNTPKFGKFILHSPTTKNSQFVFINNGLSGVQKVNDFIKKNKDAQYIHLDNGRYGYYGINPEGLRPEDFEKYYRLDLRREGTPGYNLVIKKNGGQLPKFQSKGQVNVPVDSEEINARFAALNSGTPFNYEAWLDSKFGKGPVKAKSDYENAKRTYQKQLANQKRVPRPLPSGAIEPVGSPIDAGLFMAAAPVVASGLRGLNTAMSLPATIGSKTIPWLTTNNLLNSAMAAGVAQELSNPKSELRSKPNSENITNAVLSAAGIGAIRSPLGLFNNLFKKAAPAAKLSEDVAQRLETLKSLQAEGLIAKEADLLSYAKTTEGTDDIVRRAIEHGNTRYRGVNPNLKSVKHETLGTNRNLSAEEINDLQLQMRNAGVNTDDLNEVGKYMSTHVPLGFTGSSNRTIGYRAGIQYMPEGSDLIYSATTPIGYGTNTYKVRIPFDFSKGSHNDWIKEYRTARNQKPLTDLNIDEFYNKPSEFYTGRPYDKDFSIFVGPRGHKMFDFIEEVYPSNLDPTKGGKFMGYQIKAPFKKGGPIVSSRGQWDYPGQDTIVPTPNGRITMKGVPYPVYGQDETGHSQMMYPSKEYKFPGKMVYEIPMMQPGGQKPVAKKRIYVSSKTHPRYIAYKDSLAAYRSPYLALQALENWQKNPTDKNKLRYTDLRDATYDWSSSPSLRYLPFFKNARGFESRVKETSPNTPDGNVDYLRYYKEPSELVIYQPEPEYKPRPDIPLKPIEFEIPRYNIPPIVLDKLPPIDISYLNQNLDEEIDESPFKKAVRKNRHIEQKVKQGPVKVPRSKVYYRGRPFEPHFRLKYDFELGGELDKMQDGGESYKEWKEKYGLSESEDYRLKRAWKLGYTPDSKGHLPTVDNKTGKFLKSQNHPTIGLELEWFNSPEAEQFRQSHRIDSTGRYFKYVPIEPLMQNGGSLPKFQTRGQNNFPSATSADSLALYNNALELMKYYGDNPKYKLESSEDTRNINNSAIYDVNRTAVKALEGMIKSGVNPRNNKSPENGPFAIKDYHDSSSEEPWKYKQRERNNFILDLNAPFQLYDTRIKPTRNYTFINKDKGDLLHGDLVSFFGYDPLSVKPYSMRTPEEKIEWVKKYGNNQNQPVVKPIFKKSVQPIINQLEPEYNPRPSISFEPIRNEVKLYNIPPVILDKLPTIDISSLSQNIDQEIEDSHSQKAVSKIRNIRQQNRQESVKTPRSKVYYRGRLFEPHFRTNFNFELGGSLPKFQSDKKSAQVGSNNKYPYWDYLTNDEKRFINSNSPLGLNVRGKAIHGYGINGNPTWKQTAGQALQAPFVKDNIERGLAGLSFLPGLYGYIPSVLGSGIDFYDAYNATSPELRREQITEGILGLIPYGRKVTGMKGDVYYKPYEALKALYRLNQGVDIKDMYDPNFFNSFSPSDSSTNVEQNIKYPKGPLKKMGGPLEKMWYEKNPELLYYKKGGEMIRRADGSYSRRGLWDNIRDNKGSGKKPTKEMLEQERKIKAKHK